jgi:hypothetical protein
MFADTREHFTQVALGLDAIEHTGAYDGLEDRRSSAAGIRTGEKPILPTNCRRADHVLRGIVGDLQPAVLDVARQGDLAMRKIHESGNAQMSRDDAILVLALQENSYPVYAVIEKGKRLEVS